MIPHHVRLTGKFLNVPFTQQCSTVTVIVCSGMCLHRQPDSAVAWPVRSSHINCTGRLCAVIVCFSHYALISVGEVKWFANDCACLYFRETAMSHFILGID